MGANLLRSPDFHNQLLLLRAWGYELKQIGYAAGGLDHASVIHHLRGNCRCLTTGARNREIVRRWHAGEDRASIAAWAGLTAPHVQYIWKTYRGVA